MKATVAATILLVAAACGQSHASPVTTPSPAGPPLIAVLQANGTANAWTYNTVAIVGLDGNARARATFAPMPTPKTGCMGPILQPSAHVAAGKVFFADAGGVIRSLAIDGTVATVTTFPMTSPQQMLSFAVSPDGAKLLGTVYTVPTNAWPCDGSTSSYAFDTYSATSGSRSVLLDHQIWTKPENALALTGWDAVGPIGTYPTVWASQGGGPASTLGRYVRVDPTTGKPAAELATDGCQVWHSVASGALVCMKAPTMSNGGTAQQTVTQPISVRGADGTELWQATVVGQNAPFAPYLAPDAAHFAICCNDLDLANPYELIVGRDGSHVNLAKGFDASGWLDATTVVGQMNSNMAYVASNSPNVAVSMGFAGLFVGTVRA